MNRIPKLAADPQLKILTPFPQTEHPHPSTYLRALSAGWPGPPDKILVGKFITDDDTRAMVAFIADAAKAEATIYENDFDRLREEARLLDSPHGPIVEAERLRRRAAACDLELYQKAQNDFREIETGAREFAAKLCERLATEIFQIVAVEAAVSEERRSRFGLPIGWSDYVDSETFQRWALHDDPVLCQLHNTGWILRHYLPQQYRKPTLFTETPRAWFSHLLP